VNLFQVRVSSVQLGHLIAAGVQGPANGLRCQQDAGETDGRERRNSISSKPCRRIIASLPEIAA
jgi:hypothetical protein